MTRAQWAVILGLMFSILLIFGVLLHQLQVPDPTPTSPPPAFLLAKEAQAQTVFPIAQQEALNWQADAYLASVEIVWNDLGPGGILKRDRWTFQFYSPSRQRTVVIRVVGGQAQRLRSTLSPHHLPVLSTNPWPLGSTQALQTWWRQGGSRFVQKFNNVSISLKLRPDPDSAGPIWTVVGSSSGQYWVVRLDGLGGAVLQ